MKAYLPHVIPAAKQGKREALYLSSLLQMIEEYMMYLETKRRLPKAPVFQFGVSVYLDEAAQKESRDYADELTDIATFAKHIVEFWDIRDLADFQNLTPFLKRVYADAYWVGGLNNVERVYRDGHWMDRTWEQIKCDKNPVPFAVMFNAYSEGGETGTALAIDGQQIRVMQHGKLMYERASKQLSYLRGKWKEANKVADDLLTKQAKHYENKTAHAKAYWGEVQRNRRDKVNALGELFVSLSRQRFECVREAVATAQVIIFQGHATKREQHYMEHSGADYMREMLEMVQVQTRHNKVDERTFVYYGDTELLGTHVEALERSAKLSAYFTNMYRPMATALLADLTKQEKIDNGMRRAQAVKDRSQKAWEKERDAVRAAEEKEKQDKRDKRKAKKAAEEKDKQDKAKKRQDKKDAEEKEKQERAQVKADRRLAREAEDLAREQRATARRAKKRKEFLAKLADQYTYTIDSDVVALQPKAKGTANTVNKKKGHK